MCSADSIPSVTDSAFLTPITIRTFQDADHDAVLDLFTNGLLTGHIDPYEGDEDIQNVPAAYLQRSVDHFWVAEFYGQIIGTIAVLVDQKKVAHLRRLRVAPRWQQSCVAFQLIRRATEHAINISAPKLIFHTPVNADRTIELLRTLGFVFSGCKHLRGRQLLQFYISIYEKPDLDAAFREERWRLV